MHRQNILYIKNSDDLLHIKSGAVEINGILPLLSR